PTNHRRHSPKESSDPRTFDCPPKADQESPPAPNRRNQSKTNKRKNKRLLEPTLPQQLRPPESERQSCQKSPRTAQKMQPSPLEFFPPPLPSLRRVHTE